MMIRLPCDLVNSASVCKYTSTFNQNITKQLVLLFPQDPFLSSLPALFVPWSKALRWNICSGSILSTCASYSHLKGQGKGTWNVALCLFLFVLLCKSEPEWWRRTFWRCLVFVGFCWHHCESKLHLRCCKQKNKLLWNPPFSPDF